MRRGPVLLLALGLLAALVPGVPEAAAATLQVDVKNYAFAPKNASIAKGDTVKWHWVNGTHNVLQDGTNAVWCSTRSTGDCTRAFPATGNFTYHCGLHPSMKGNVFVDQAAPIVVITAPAEGATVRGRFTAAGTATHETGIADVQLRLGDGSWATASGTANWTAEVDSNPLPNREHALRARATPVTGPAAEATITLVVQNPPVLLDVLQPDDGAIVVGALPLAGGAGHAFNPITQVRWRLDGGAWSNLTLDNAGTTAKWRGLFVAASVPGGAHRLEFQAGNGYAVQDSPVVARAITVINPVPLPPL